MLLYFSVGGYLSFDEEQEFFFTAPKGARLNSTKYQNNFHLNRIKLNKPMKSSLIMGDNASGKTNFIFSLMNLRNIILGGFDRREDPDKYNRTNNQVSYCIEVSDKDDVFTYKLKYSHDNEENNKNNVLDNYIDVKFESLYINNKIIYEFDRKKLILSKNIDSYETLQKLFSRHESSATFLSKLRDFVPNEIKAFMNSIKNITIRYDMFFNPEAKEMEILNFDEKSKNLLLQHKEKTIEMLQIVDKTIDDILFKETLTKPNEKSSVAEYEVLLIRGNNEYNLKYESQGIKKIVYLLDEFLEMSEGKTVIVDELDSSIGTKSLIKIFNNFINSDSNTNGQLIISSHNLMLMNLDMFHPSQIYIISKGNTLASKVSIIDEFDLRTEAKDIYKMYLKGSFEEC